MIQFCIVCGGDFETGNRSVLCSPICRKKRRHETHTRWRLSNKEIVSRSQEKTRHKRDAAGKTQAYRTERGNSAGGYIDKFMYRASLETRDTDLTRDFFTDKMDTCAFSGKKFVFKNEYDAYHNPKAPSIDRINSKRGYYKDNVQVIWSCLNRMKSDLPQEDFNSMWRELTQ